MFKMGKTLHGVAPNEVGCGQGRTNRRRSFPDSRVHAKGPRQESSSHV